MIIHWLSATAASIRKNAPQSVPQLLSSPFEKGLTRSFDGTSIYWERHGPRHNEPSKKPAMIFCYGLICSMNQWREQIEYFKKTNTCILLDYRGHHKSAFPEDSRSMNISCLAKDVKAVMQANNITQPSIIWGHSLGCQVALELAIAHPDLVKHLILICGCLNNPFKKMFPYGENVIHKLLSTYDKYPFLFHSSWKKILMLSPEITRYIAFHTGFNAKASTADDGKAYAAAISLINPRTFYALLRDLTRGLSPSLVSKIKAPSYIISGANDKVTPASNQKELHQALPQSTFISIPAGSHNVQLDFGDYINMKVESLWNNSKSSTNLKP